MTHSDRVRAYCLEEYVEPARARGEESVEIRAGDVHRALEYHNRMPLVCSALGSLKFENEARVERVSIKGPLNGANTVFTFRIL